MVAVPYIMICIVKLMTVHVCSEVFNMMKARMFRTKLIYINDTFLRLIGFWNVEVDSGHLLTLSHFHQWVGLLCISNGLGCTA